MSGWLEQEIVRLAALVERDRDQRRLADVAVGSPELVAAAEAYLAEHPGATSNAVWRALGGRRNDVLLAVRKARVLVPRRDAA